MIAHEADLIVLRARQALIRPLIVLLVLALCLYIGRRPSTLLVLALVSSVALLVLMRQPVLGLVALLGSSFVLSFGVGTGTTARFEAPIMITGGLAAWWIFDSLRARRPILQRSSVNGPLLGLVVIMCMSAVVGNVLWDYRVTVTSTARLPLVQLGQIAILAMSACVFLLAANVITDLRWLRIVTYVFIAFACLALLPGIAGLLSVPLPAITAPLATAGLFNVWIVSLAYGQLLFNRKLAGAGRCILVLILAFVAYSSFWLSRTWATGWLPPMVAVIAITWLRSRRLGLVLSSILVAGIVMNQSFMANRLVGDELAQGTVFRPRIWSEVSGLTAKNAWTLLVGLGPANYRYYYQTYYPVAVFGNWTVQMPQINSHNNYIDIFAQTGLLGLGVFIWFLWEMVRVGRRVRQKLRAEGGFAEAYANGVLGGFTGVLVACVMADWFLPFIYNIGLPGFRHSLYSWLFLGGLVALDRIVQSASPDAIVVPEVNLTGGG